MLITSKPYTIIINQDKNSLGNLLYLLDNNTNNVNNITCAFKSKYFLLDISLYVNVDNIYLIIKRINAYFMKNVKV